MKELKKYRVDIVGLQNKKYEYDFEAGAAFFESFEKSLVKKANLKVEVSLEKTETMVLVDFRIRGFVNLVCDRSLEEFDHPTDIREKFIFKFGEEDTERDDNLVIIPANTQSIDLSKYIYELVSLSIPMKKIHPLYRDNDNDSEETKFIYTSSAKDDEDKEDSDPRWAVLNDLKK